MEGNSCGNRAVSNIYYKYLGTSVTTETKGTNIYLITNPEITGTDPAPLAFTNLFNALGQLSAGTLSSAQSLFSINYLTGTYITSFNIRQMTPSTRAQGLTVYFDSPVYDSGTLVLTVSNIQLIGNVGTVYFVLVLYKQIITNADGSNAVNIRLNEPPTAEQVLNCQNWQGETANGCGRAVYTGISALTLTFTGVQTNSLYMLYYMPTTEFPLRPITSGDVYSQSIVTYSFEHGVKFALLLSSILLLILLS
jgi:hypothetical protein